VTFDAIMVGSGVLWTLAYLLMIRRGFLDRTYGMPLVALCANLSWEFIFSFVYPHDLPQRAVNVVWFSFDLVILLQLLLYGPREFADLPRAFYAVLALALAASFGVVLAVTYEFDDFDGVYSAFGQNLMMSVLFIAMLRSRGSLRGQSVGIALSKMGGTALAAFAFYFHNPDYAGSVLLPLLYVTTLVFDGIYAGAVIVLRRQKKHNNSLAG
jgi:predicted outer membrane lipoprotein